MPPISLLIKPASGQCNLRCKYCFYADEAKNRDKESYGIMSDETLENVVKKATETAEGYLSICFQGGEPTIAGIDFYRHFVELEKKYAKPNLTISHSIQTNGTLLTEEWAQFLSKNHFLTGVSVDGTIHTHNAYRKAADGSDTFLQVMHGLDLLRKYNVDFNILTVVNQRTAAIPDKIYNYIKKQGYQYVQFIPCLDPLTSEGESHLCSEYSLTPKAYGEFLCRIFDLWYLDLQHGTQPFIRQFENYITLLLYGRTESCDMNGKCSIQYVVEADGGVYPCDFYVLDDFRLGNLNTDNFSTIDKARLDLKFIERSEPVPDTCSACQWLSICRNGCYRHRIDHTDMFCMSWKMFFEHSIDRLVDIARTINL